MNSRYELFSKVCHLKKKKSMIIYRNNNKYIYIISETPWYMPLKNNVVYINSVAATHS